MVRNVFVIEFAENRVLGPLLDPQIKHMTPSGSFLGCPGGPSISQKTQKSGPKRPLELDPPQKNWDQHNLNLLWGPKLRFRPAVGSREGLGNPIFGRFSIDV